MNSKIKLTLILAGILILLVISVEVSSFMSKVPKNPSGTVQRVVLRE